MKMTVKQIEKVFYHDPFQPFRVLLENGEEVIVQKPRKASVSGDQVAIVGLTALSEDELLRLQQQAGIEFVNGQILEKPVSKESSRVAAQIIFLLQSHVRKA